MCSVCERTTGEVGDHVLLQSDRGIYVTLCIRCLMEAFENGRNKCTNDQPAGAGSGSGSGDQTAGRDDCAPAPKRVN